MDQEQRKTHQAKLLLFKVKLSYGIMSERGLRRAAPSSSLSEDKTLVVHDRVAGKKLKKVSSIARS
jgi:hypothetical protein